MRRLSLGWKISNIARMFGYKFLCDRGDKKHEPDAFGDLRCMYCKKFKRFVPVDRFM